jgi:hypothetical protein
LFQVIKGHLGLAFFIVGYASGRQESCGGQDGDIKIRLQVVFFISGNLTETRPIRDGKGGFETT